MSNQLPGLTRSKLIATKRSVDGHLVRVFAPEATTGAAEYLLCWIRGHGHSINDPGSCPYCGEPIPPARFTQTHCPYCDEPVHEIDFARNYCADCDSRTTPSERSAWIINAELGTPKCTSKRAAEKDGQAKAAFKEFYAEPASAADKARIAVYSLEGDRQVTTVTYTLAVRWVALGVAHWLVSDGGQVALRMRELLSLSESFWSSASITTSECLDNALKGVKGGVKVDHSGGAKLDQRD
jgi:hypothetical protein